MSKSYRQILEAAKTKAPPKDESQIREDYISESIFHIGDMVKTKSGDIAEIIARGTNYLTLIKEGKTFKAWLKDVKPLQTEETKTRNAQLYKESFIIKGYKTRHFTREISEAFRDLAKSNSDTYAVYNSVVCFDKLLGMTDVTMQESFEDYRITFERATKYFKKFDLTLAEMANIEDKLYEAAITHGFRFTMIDKLKLANLIASVAGFTDDSGETAGTPETIVNWAARKVRNQTHTPDAWEILGRIFQSATDAGIKWDKEIFSKTRLKSMELE